VRRSSSVVLVALVVLAWVLLAGRRAEPLRAGSAALAVAPGTGRATVLLLSVREKSIELKDAVEKASAAREADPGDERWALEDERTGAVRAEGSFELPAVATDGVDRWDGCTRVPGEALIRLEVPGAARGERLRITGADGQVLALLHVEAHP